MKVVIPAAGKGTRMLELGLDRPKALIEICDKPFMYYVLDSLKKAGFTEMIIVTGYQKEKMQEFCDKYKDEFPITLVDQFEKVGTEKYGTLCPIEAVKDIIDESFACVYGDNLYSPKDLRAMINKDNCHYITGMHHENPERYGVLFEEDGMLKNIIEKPKEYVGNYINTGLYKFTTEIFDIIDEIKISERGEYELTDAIRILAERGKVKVHHLQEYWLDFGKPEDIEKISKFLEKK